jgi:hypothetical protein
MTLRIERYKHTRHWALYDGAEAGGSPGGPGPRPARRLGRSATDARWSASTGGLGGTPRANPPRWRWARRAACARRRCGARTPGAPRRDPVSSSAGLGVDCVAETTVV